MDLEELLRREGLDAEGLRQTVAWARRRAEELVAPLVADAELGPLLDAQWEEESRPNIELAALARASARAAPRPATPVRERARDSERKRSIATKSTADEQPPRQEPSIRVTPREEPADRDAPPLQVQQRELGDREESIVEEATQPYSFDRPEAARADAAPREPLAPTNTDAIDQDEIELLDDDDLELVEESLARGRIPRESEDVPEWKAALSSAQMGGGADADHESGLLPVDRIARPPIERLKDGSTPSEDSGSLDVDVSDID